MVSFSLEGRIEHLLRRASLDMKGGDEEASLRFGQLICEIAAREAGGAGFRVDGLGPQAAAE